jgi:antitoxin component YwqK of YwqJK toxin-antitoxin module
MTSTGPQDGAGPREVSARSRWARVALLGVAALAGAATGCRQGAGPGPTSQPAMAPAPKVETIEEHWPNGQLKLRHEVQRKPDGALVDQGTYTTWYDNGQKQYEATYVQGKEDGVVTTWHRNGQKFTEQHYARGRREGARVVWDEEGNKRKEEFFVDDQPDGTWTQWKKDGTIEWQGHFDHGQPSP